MIVGPQGLSLLTAGSPPTHRDILDQWDCWVQSDAGCLEGYHLRVTWPFSFTHVDIRAGDSASQIRHEPSDQNWVIWKDVALQHSGLTVFGLVVFGDGDLSC